MTEEVALCGLNRSLQSRELAVSERKALEDRQPKEIETPTEAARLGDPNGADSPLLALAEQFKSLVADLSAVQGLSDRLASNADQHRAQTARAGEKGDATSQTEAVLARLYPVELSILATPAHTIADLGVKACHAAYVMSEYWEAPIDHLDWDSRTIRLLIEAVCNFTGTPLPLSERNE
jgi:hypothetical protein